MKEEKQLELELPLLEPEFTLKFTEEELKRIYQITGFVSKGTLLDSVHKKIERCVDKEELDDSYENVFLRQVTVEEGSFILPRVEDLSLYDNGYVLVIKD